MIPGRAVVLIVVIVVLFGAARLRSGQTPARAISGIVEVEDNGRRVPVRRAAVTLTSETAKVTQQTHTDNEGRFTFSTAVPGRFGVQAKKPGFLQLKEIVVTGAGPFTVEMMRAAALEGRFIETTGKPIQGLSVYAESISDGGFFTAKTDDLGRFRIHTIRPGQYRLYSYPPSLSAGEKHFYPGTEDVAQATVITLVPGQTGDGLVTVVPVVPTQAIAAEAIATQELEAIGAPPDGGKWNEVSGRVTSSASGQPIVGARVRLSSSTGVLLRTAWTDGDGGYLFTRMISGTYFIAAAADGHMSPEAAPGTATSAPKLTASDGAKSKKDFVLIPLSGIEGRVIDDFGDGVPDVSIQVMQRIVGGDGQPHFIPIRGVVMTGVTDDRGWYRASVLGPGDYYVIALPPPFGVPYGVPRPAPFPVTYFPGALTAAGANPVRLTAGIDAHGVNFTVPLAASTTIKGEAFDPKGRTQPLNVRLIPVEDGQASLPSFVMATSETGRFEIPNVPEGSYVIQAGGQAAFDPVPVSITRATGPELVVQLRLRPFSSVSGKVVFEGDTPPAARELGLMWVRFQPSDSVRGEAVGGTGMSQLTADYRFSIKNVAWPGVLRMSREMQMVSTWSLSRVLLNGRDITDVEFDFSGGDVDGVEMILSRRAGSLSGTLASGTKEAANVFVIGADSVVPAYIDRTTRIAAFSDTGEFKISNVPPGRYYAVAIGQIANINDFPDLLRLRALGTLVTITEGVDTVVRLAVVKSPLP